MLFNVYIGDIPKTKSRQYGYADDLALCYSHKSLHMVEEALNYRHGIDNRISENVETQTEIG